MQIALTDSKKKRQGALLKNRRQRRNLAKKDA